MGEREELKPNEVDGFQGVRIEYRTVPYRPLWSKIETSESYRKDNFRPAEREREREREKERERERGEGGVGGGWGQRVEKGETR